MNRLLLFCILAIASCSKEPLCERTVGDLVITNVTNERQSITVSSATAEIPSVSTVVINDLQAGYYTVVAVGVETGSKAEVMVEVKPCEETRIVI